MRLTDPTTIRALAHPLRLSLIELLGTVGPATAAQCARHLDSTQANCSFHLRQLAKYGFVEKAPSSGDGRENPWQLTDLEQSWSSGDGGPATRELERVFIQREAERMLSWRAGVDQQPESWRDASFLSGATIPMTTEELSSVAVQLRAVLEPYIQRLSERSDWPEDCRFVRVLLAGTPVANLDEER
ncbi:ArsR/SmtB family transcription factor [Phytoactinopolyspora mesophila]|uniref:Helix-turn-helix domain-containing protein n=1 Tax=Phytoactinopolyspora mesophila TaxID=2650750 RepID=A0A7K3M9N9_9ACTN|nr:helix-turn-helix domain-containing protein [Phytoactinopolyspora mesophila]NDL59128.1 helix-turn-helix domain-containing protein [Phytoactinopolyspora mesophila]